MIHLDYENIVPDIQQLIEEENSGAVINILVDLHPADIEEIVNRLKKDQRKFIFNLLPPDLASEVLSELEAPIVEQVLEDASEEHISELVDRMDSDDAADLIGELPEEIAEKVLDQMELEASSEVQELLHHEEDTAGGIMAMEFVSMPETATVNETIDAIRDAREEVENIYTIWVVGEDNKLTGKVSLTDLVLAKGYTTLREIMDIDVHSVQADLDQEEVATLFSKYDLVSLPVINTSGQIVGRITFDDIVDVLEEEGSEDLALLAGAPGEEVLEESAFVLSRARIPWLLVSFFGNIIAAFILEAFDVTIKAHIASAFFFPLIMAMGGSAGQQASVIVVRGIALGDIHLSDTRKRLLKEFRVSMINSAFFAILIFFIIYFWQGIVFAVILSLSLFIVINGAAVLGAFIPLVFKRMDIDPAMATAPFIATINDVFGLLTYLVIITMALSAFS